MHSKTGKNLISLVITAILLIAGNAWVWMSIQNGQIPPVEQLPLWGSFVALNTISLLWAANALNLQPLVMGIAYLTGGFLAYRGVQGIENVNVAEITTAGAAYGAIGALAVGQISTKVCTVFSNKIKVPFYVVIILLLVVDGLLNSQILGSDLNTILNAVVLPFVLSGVVLGMIWTGISYFISKEKPADDTAPAATSSKKKTQTSKPAAKTTAKPATKSPKKPVQQQSNKTPAKTKPLKKQQPAQASTSKPTTPATKPKTVLKTQPKPAPKISTKPATNFAKKSTTDEQFFPLEIDKDDDFVPPVEKKSPPPVKPKPAPPKPVAPKPEPPKPAPETPKPASDSTNDWLSGHLDLLNKIDHDPKD